MAARASLARVAAGRSACCAKGSARPIFAPIASIAEVARDKIISTISLKEALNLLRARILVSGDRRARVNNCLQ
jgi:hypothetical protein